MFNAMIPVYPHVDKMPEYLSKAYVKPTTDSFYWANRIIGALADAHYYENQSNIERYQVAVEKTTEGLDKVLFTSSSLMRNGFSRSDS